MGYWEKRAMLIGLYASANGMMAIERQHDVVANNIANAATPGFKRQSPVVKGFNEVLFDSMHHPSMLNAQKGPGGGLVMDETFNDFGAGPITSTGNPLDIAVEGPAFIVVQTPNGERFTRNGQFLINVDGQLATSDGHLVQSADGAGIDVSAGNIDIASDGSVRSNGEAVGRIRLVEFEQPGLLQRDGDTLFTASDAVRARSADAVDSAVMWKSLEQSNVQVANEMLKLTLGLRAYEANQRSIAAVYETTGRLIDQVGTPI